MPHSISWEENGSRTVFRGHVTGEEIARSSVEIRGNPRFDSMRYQIVDFSNIEGIEITLDEVREIAALDAAAAATNPRMKVAIISDSETVDTGAAAYKADNAESPWETEIFRTLDEARRWVEGRE